MRTTLDYVFPTRCLLRPFSPRRGLLRRASPPCERLKGYALEARQPGSSECQDQERAGENEVAILCSGISEEGSHRPIPTPHGLQAGKAATQMPCCGIAALSRNALAI